MPPVATSGPQQRRITLAAPSLLVSVLYHRTYHTGTSTMFTAGDSVASDHTLTPNLNTLARTLSSGRPPMMIMRANSLRPSHLPRPVPPPRPIPNRPRQPIVNKLPRHIRPNGGTSPYVFLSPMALRYTSIENPLTNSPRDISPFVSFPTSFMIFLVTLSGFAFAAFTATLPSALPYFVMS